MRNILLIARREYMERIRAKSFVVMTVLIPLLMGGSVLSFGYFGGKAHEAHITIVSPDAALALHLQDDLATLEPDTTVDLISPPTPDTNFYLSEAVENKNIEGYLWVDAFAAQQAIFYGVPSRRHVDEVQSLLAKYAAQSDLRLPVTVSVQSIRMSKRASEKENLTHAESAKAVAYFLFFLMYFAVMLYGMNVARSITEEKTSRVFEVMLATITPEEMMAGKVIGVGGVGLTQVFIWIATAALLVATPLVPMLIGTTVSVSLTIAQMLFFVLMFVLGFMLYSGIAAILGAIVNSEQELQQLTMVLALPLAFCMMLLYPTSSNPNGTLATVASFIPLCTPLLMFTRVVVGHPPFWQIALSVVDLVLAIYAMMWIASRIYRVGILMYGKRPSLGEILRWMRYS